MQITNRRILEFCDKHPTFDLENTLLSFIDFIDKANETVAPSLDSNLAEKILSNLKTLQNHVISIDSNIATKQSQIKREYIDEIKNIVTINNSERIVPMLKEYNESFFNKISLFFKDTIPKEQQECFRTIQQTLIAEIERGSSQKSIDTIIWKMENVLSALSDNKEIHQKVDTMISKLTKNTDKGRISENFLNINLQELYPNAEIINTANTPHAGDFWIVRKDKPSILVENKNHEDRVYSDDVQKFINDMNTQNMSGVMISQLSSIVHRENYEIEIHNGNVAVYIHHGNYEPNKIKIAVQIIDTFKEKIQQKKVENGDSFTIDTETISRINKEYQLFNIKKMQHIAEIKSTFETLIKSAEDMELAALDQLLESLGILTNIKKFVCSNCPRTFKTQKGLDTHERQCKTVSKRGIQCEFCDQTIPTKKGYIAHCQKKHPDVIHTEFDR
jgi:hypothetical protein